MGILQEGQVVVGIESLGFVVSAAYKHLHRHAADPGEGEHRIGNLAHAAFQLCYLAYALRTGDVEQQQ